MNINSLEAIESKKLLLVEGKDDDEFFAELLKSLNINDCEICYVNGSNEFNSKIPLLTKRSGFDNLEMLLIIRDADTNAMSARSSIHNIIKKASLVPPGPHTTLSSGRPKVGIYILPDNSSEGAIEDLCLKIVEKDKKTKCVENFINCANKLNDSPNNISKAKVQAFLAIKSEIANTLGLAAKKGYWDFNSVHLSDLKHFLENLR